MPFHFGYIRPNPIDIKTCGTQSTGQTSTHMGATSAPPPSHRSPSECSSVLEWLRLEFLDQNADQLHLTPTHTLVSHFSEGYLILGIHLCQQDIIPVLSHIFA